jgi:hypothetical protein
LAAFVALGCGSSSGDPDDPPNPPAGTGGSAGSRGISTGGTGGSMSMGGTGGSAGVGGDAGAGGVAGGGGDAGAGGIAGGGGDGGVGGAGACGGDECPFGEFCVRGECSPPLLAEMSVDSNPVVQAVEPFRVYVTVTNPTETETVNDVTVEVLLPEGTTRILGWERSVGSRCNSNNCSAGNRVAWDIGSLEPGESRVVYLEPVSADAFAGNQMSFATRVTASNAQTVNEELTVDVVADRALNLQVVESSNPVEFGGALTYVLHYGNQGETPLSEVELTLAIPTDAATIGDTGGGSATEGTISWDIGRLAPGENGTRRAVIAVDAAPGEQVRAEAALFDASAPLEGTTAIVQTPVSESPLLAFIEVSPDPKRQDALNNVTVTVTNPSANLTRRDVKLRVRLPQNLTRLFAFRRTDDSSCTSNNCGSGDTVRWEVGSLRPGESQVASFGPTVNNDATDGTLMMYLLDVREAPSGTPEVEQKSVLSKAVAALRRDRPFNLWMVESANPIPSGDSLSYRIHYANRSNATIDGAALSLATRLGDVATLDTDGGSASGDKITWALGSLAPGASGILQPSFTVGSAAGEVVRAEATLSSSDSSEQTRATVHTPVGESSLVTTMSTTADSVQPGGTFTLTITVENTSAIATEDFVKVQLRLPFGIDRILAADRSNGGCSGNVCDGGDKITWDIDGLAPGESTELDLQVLVPVSDTTPLGSLLYFESQTLVGNSAADSRVIEATTVGVVAP